MKAVYAANSETVKLGNKGQITLPKKLRDKDKYVTGDVFVIQQTPGGDLILRKKQVKTPEDRMLEILKTIPPFDWRSAWQEVHEERRRERA